MLLNFEGEAVVSRYVHASVGMLHCMLYNVLFYTVFIFFMIFKGNSCLCAKDFCIHV